MGARGKNPTMQIVARFFFTNLTNEPIKVLHTLLAVRYRKWGLVPINKKVEGMVMVRSSRENIYGDYFIPSRLTTEASADWWIEPPIKRQGQNFRGRVCFIDNFGNKHWSNLLTWKYR